MTDNLAKALKELRLSGLQASLDVRLQEAAGHSLNHAEFLELILQDELSVRSDRQLQRRVKAASFRELKTLDDFDDHGTVARTVDADVDGAKAVLASLAEVGVDLADVTATLETEGVASFSKSFDELLGALSAKADSFK